MLHLKTARSSLRSQLSHMESTSSNACVGLRQNEDWKPLCGRPNLTQVATNIRFQRHLWWVCSVPSALKVRLKWIWCKMIDHTVRKTKIECFDTKTVGPFESFLILVSTFSSFWPNIGFSHSFRKSCFGPGPNPARVTVFTAMIQDNSVDLCASITERRQVWISQDGLEQAATICMML